MVPARIQAIKLAGELATKKAQLHKLLGVNTSDGEYIQRMQKAENVNQILSRVLRDVISKHPEIADAVRKELAIAFEIMEKEEAIDVESEEVES
jgi:outer membrane protein TolC